MNARYCPACGAEVQVDWAYCKFCRHDFGASPALEFDRTAFSRTAGRRRRLVGGSSRATGMSTLTKVALGAVGLAVFGVAVSASGVLEHEPPPNDAPVVLATDWVTVAPGGGFRADLPAEPSQGVTSRVVGSLTLQVNWFTASRGPAAYAVGYVDYPPEIDVSDAAATLAGVPDGAAAEVQGAVRSTAPSTLAGHPAIDYEVVAPDGSLAEATAALVGTRMYLVQAVGPAEHRPQFDRLRDSFTLVAGP